MIPARRMPALVVVALLALPFLIPQAVAQTPIDVQPSDPAAAAPENAAPLSQDDPIPMKNLMDIVGEGGVLMLPIVFCSFILVVFVFERFISLRRGRVLPRHFAKRLIHQLKQGQLDRDAALIICEENNSPAAKVFAAAIQKWGRPAVEVEQAIIDAGERAANDLRRYLRVINGVATVSPLLGLLGTVVGMIRAFNAIATTQAMGRPELLAGGISQALLTTAAGLTVAIPALIFYLFFTSRVDRLVIDIDALGQDIVASISAEAERPPKPKAARARQRDSAA